MVADVRLGDTVRMRKAHPCGSFEWEVVRVGADIRLRCLACDRRVLLSRSALEKRTKSVDARRPAP